MVRIDDRHDDRDDDRDDERAPGAWLEAYVSGTVQGVGFRAWARSVLAEVGVRGTARNLDDGRVLVSAHGSHADLDRLVGLLGERPTTTDRPGTVTDVRVDVQTDMRGDLPPQG